jgi:cyanophycin synthetase
VRLTDLRRLNGPNIYTSRPVTVARLELDGLTGHETSAHAGFAARLLAALPGLAGHHCAAGQPGGFTRAMARGTYFGHVTEHVALELSGLAGRDVYFGRTVWAGADGRYDVVMECPWDEPADSPVPRDLLCLALRVVGDVLAERAHHLDATLAEITSAVEQARLGVSTAALAEAARSRGIPVGRVGGLSLLKLGYGCHRRLAWAALTDQTSAVGVDIACDKVLAKQLLAGAGVPVPEGVVVHDEMAAVQAFADLGAPVVVKPRSGNQGGGITVGVATAAEAVQAYRHASAVGPAVIVEKYVPGTDYRILVVDGRMIAAARVRPATVTGDGVHDIAALVEIANADPRRGDGHARPLTKIPLDSEALACLAGQGLDPGSVPGPGELACLRRNANLSTGGSSTDVTDLVHPEVADLCCRAAAAIGLDVCGIDIRLVDISAPLHAARAGRRAGAVIEVNASPGLRMHLAPSAGRPRQVAGAILDRLYPPGALARIPVVSVTGTNGKTTTVRMISHILGQAGLRVGMATTDGVTVAGRLIKEADAAGPCSAEMILDDPAVEAAVLETARGGIVRRGLGYDKADVAVVTNITADHLGADGIDDLDDLTEVKALVAEEIQRGGTLVLNADDTRTAALATRPVVRERNPVIRYFSLDGRNPVIVAHRMSGGITCELRGRHLVETRGGEEAVLLSADDLPGSFGGAAAHLIANALAACAACRALGVSAKDIRHALSTFTPEQANPGRGNAYQVAGRPVVVDYGHNPAALAAMGRLLHDTWPGDAVAAITLPGDRRDDLVAETAAAVATWFGRVVIYEDRDLRGRRPGEMTALIRAALEEQRPGITIATAGGPAEALRSALALASGPGPVLLTYEKLPPVREALAALDAVLWPAGQAAPLDQDLAGPRVVQVDRHIVGGRGDRRGAGVDRDRLPGRGPVSVAHLAGQAGPPGVDHTGRRHRIGGRAAGRQLRVGHAVRRGKGHRRGEHALLAVTELVVVAVAPAEQQAVGQYHDRLPVVVEGPALGHLGDPTGQRHLDRHIR